MSDNKPIKKANSPEEDELELKRAELAKSSELLAEKELELSTLKNSVLHFEHRYLMEVVIKYVELDEINAQIAVVGWAASTKNERQRWWVLPTHGYSSSKEDICRNK